MISSSLPILHHCRWNWCREYFRSREALIDHLAQHLADAEPVRAGDLRALRQAEQGQSFEDSFLPHFSQFSQSITISSTNPSNGPADVPASIQQQPQLVPDDSTNPIPRPTHESVMPYSQFSHSSMGAQGDEDDEDVDMLDEDLIVPPAPPVDPEAEREMSQYIVSSPPPSPLFHSQAGSPMERRSEPPPSRQPVPSSLHSSHYATPFATQAPPPPSIYPMLPSSTDTSQSSEAVEEGLATQQLLAAHRQMVGSTSQMGAPSNGIQGRGRGTVAGIEEEPEPGPSTLSPSSQPKQSTPGPSITQRLGKMLFGGPQSQSRPQIEQQEESQSGFGFATQAPAPYIRDSQESY